MGEAYVGWYGKARRQDWETPRTLFDPLNAEYAFDLDGAAEPGNALLPQASTVEKPVPWTGRRVFCNPPWSNIAPFVEEAPKARLAVLLVPARTNARWFHRAIELGATVRFFLGRPKFGGNRAVANSPVDCLLLVWEKKTISPLRSKGMDAPVRWFCSFCSEEHAPDIGTLIDARYTLGRCGKYKRQLVRDRDEALHLASTVGKFREKGVPLGGGQRKPQISIADAAKIKAIQGGPRVSGNARPVLKRIRGSFWDHVDKTGDCWEWTGARTSTGYGNCKFEGATTKAHRASWIMAHGSIPDGLLVCHKCDNRPCVRPEHLFLGTNSDNLRDSVAKGRYMSDKRRAAIPIGAAKQRGRPCLSGEKNPNAKLTVREISEIRRRYATGAVTQSALAIEHRVSQRTVSFIVRGERWVGP